MKTQRPTRQLVLPQKYHSIVLKQHHNQMGHLGSSSVVRRKVGNLPVYEVQPENYDGHTRTIHRNLLLPCNFLPVEQPAPHCCPLMYRTYLLQQNSNPNDGSSNSSDSDSEAEIDPDLSEAHPFSCRNRTDAPSGQALSNTADRTPPGWQRPQ